MANIRAIKNGNFSDSSIWETGSVPTTGDTAYANGAFITIDASISVQSITNEALTSTFPVVSNVVPVMTSNSQAGFVASVGGSAVLADAYKAFDNVFGTGISLATNDSVIIQLPIAKTVKYFFGYWQASASMNFNLYGSNDGSNWSTSLCTYSTSNGSGGFSTLSSNTTAYLYYKFTNLGNLKSLYGVYLSEGTVLPTYSLGNYNTGNGVATAGGRFVVSSAIDINCVSMYNGSALIFLTLSHSSGTVNITLSGSYTCLSANNVVGINATGAGITNITGVSFTAGAAASYAIWNTGSGLMTVSGTLNYGSSTGYALTNIVGSTVVINGTLNGCLNQGTMTVNGAIVATSTTGLVNQGDLTITNSSSISGPGIGLSSTAPSTKTINISCPITTSTANAGVSITGDATYNITYGIGNCIMSANGAGYCLDSSGAGIINITGSITQKGITALSAMVRTSGSGTLNLIGNCLGSQTSGTPSQVYLLINSGTGSVYITGNVTMYDVSLSATLGLIQNTSTGYIKVTGNVTGGSVANTINISNTGTRTGANTAKIEVTGYCYGGTHGTMSPAIYSITSTENDITGECKANSFPALYSTHATAINKLRGNIISTGSVMAYYALKVLCTSTNQVLRMQEYVGNTNRDLTGGASSSNFPAITKVRNGTIYGNSSEYTGTCIVPPKQSVVSGVPVDDGVGISTGVISSSDVWKILLSELIIDNSIGKRLIKSATVASTGAQISALK